MALAHAWTHATVGRRAPVEQAKLWALREVLRKQGEEDTQYQWMPTKVKLVGGGHPEREAVRQFFQRVDKDGNWHPGKRGEVGAPVQLSGQKRHAIAKSMMAKKKARTAPLPKPTTWLALPGLACPLLRGSMHA